MPPPEKLGGFKVLRDVARISMVSLKEAGDLPVRVFQALADRTINLPYATCVFDGCAWGLSVVVEACDAARALKAIETASRTKAVLHPDSAILSIFPHRRNPEITRALFEAFVRAGIFADALASSPSAISLVIDQTMLTDASEALFGPFIFSAYRTPEEWKLAQKGKEELFKEVVASYQEKRPKVYGLEYQDRQALLQTRLGRAYMAILGPLFGQLARPGLSLTFLAAGPWGDSAQEQIAFCVPLSEEGRCRHSLSEGLLAAAPERIVPTAAFFMNGPHFGDRYGIVSELLTAFGKNHVDLLGLSCTIASITGVVPSSQLLPAIEAIQERFDIPSVIERT